MGSANFNVGGFGAESYNMLASHIDIVTKDPNFNECEAKFGVSNFMVSGYASAPIKEEKLALEVAARVSPLSLEYEMGKKWIEDKLTLFNNLEAGVYDIYGKLSYKPDAKHTVNETTVEVHVGINTFVHLSSFGDDLWCHSFYFFI